MRLIDWTNKYETGIDVVDEQHRGLVDIINKFYEALKKGKGSRVMNEILNDLVNYTHEHFASEEALMQEASYAKLDQHRCQHRQLLQKVERFQLEFTQQDKRITPEVRDFLKYWLVNHILQDDMEFSSAVTQKA